MNFTSIYKLGEKPLKKIIKGKEKYCKMYLYLLQIDKLVDFSYLWYSEGLFFYPDNGRSGVDPEKDFHGERFTYDIHRWAKDTKARLYEMAKG